MKSVIIFLLVALLSLMLLQACSSLGQPKESQIKKETISRRDLIRTTYQSDVYYVVYNDQDGMSFLPHVSQDMGVTKSK